MVKRLVLVCAFVVAVSVASLATLTGITVFADGNDSPVACNDNQNVNPNADNVLGSQEGTDDEVTVDVGDGKIVTGVCIKSGDDSFGNKQHSGVITENGVVEGSTAEDCYEVEGIGTQEVTVTRISEGSDCKGISHIDVLIEQENGVTPPPPTPPTPPPSGGVVLGGVTQPPVGGVSAGAGGAASASLMVPGLVSSIAVLGYGVMRLRSTE